MFLHVSKILNLGEKPDLSAGWTKSFMKKRSIEGYVSTFHKTFRPRCAKDGFSVNCAE